MNKLAAKAFEKLEKREHFLRVIRNRMGLGRMTREEFKSEEYEITKKYELTEEEHQAYESHLRMQEQKSQLQNQKRKSK